MSKGNRYLQLNDKEWLFGKYWIEGLNIPEIAKIVGCAKSTVSCAFKKFGIPRRTNSEAKKGHPCSEKTKRKISESERGKKVSKDARGKMSKAKKGEKHPNYGKHRSDATKQSISEAVKGKNNPNWKGGGSFEPYCQKFNAKFKDYIRDKFGGVCFLCGKTEKENGRKLSVHHVNYNKNCFCEDDSSCQFIPLCIGCHNKTNHNQEYWERAITIKLHEKINGWFI
jgi:hypothetical protein